jgi:hypothetical protein
MNKILFVVLLPIVLIALVWFLMGELNQPKAEQTKIPETTVEAKKTTTAPKDQPVDTDNLIPEGKGTRHLNPI